jgi:hypothetical protein
MKRKVWKLMKRPEGMDFEDALSLIEEDINDSSDGNLIIKLKIISMDAGTRMLMSDREDSYQPPLEIGANMVGVCLAEVIETKNPKISNINKKGDKNEA